MILATDLSGLSRGSCRRGLRQQSALHDQAQRQQQRLQRAKKDMPKKAAGTIGGLKREIIVVSPSVAMCPLHGLRPRSDPAMTNSHGSRPGAFRFARFGALKTDMLFPADPPILNPCLL
jgi:hypothetical protein